MKCGVCGTRMKEKAEQRLGLEIKVQECPHCGKRLIDLADAERLQERALSHIEDVRKVVAIGNSIGITLPASLKKFLKKGDRVRLVWDMDTMEARLAKA